MITNILAQLVICVVTNWIGYEGFKLEYENNITYCNVNTVNNFYSPKVTFDERQECPFVNQVVASTNLYARIGEVIRIEKYVIGDKEVEISRKVIGYARQEGRKLVRVEWQWDEVTLNTNRVVDASIWNIIPHHNIPYYCVTNTDMYAK